MNAIGIRARPYRHREENMTEDYLQRMTLLQFPSSGPHAPRWTRYDIARVSDREYRGYVRARRVSKYRGNLAIEWSRIDWIPDSESPNSQVQ